MSLKNNFVNMMTKKLIKGKPDETMIEVFRTAREDVKFDENNFRISNFEVPVEYKYTQYFCNDIRLEEMKHFSYNPSNENANVVLFFHGGGYIGRLNTIYTKFMYNFCKLVHNYKIISVEYRTLREHTFPCAYEDALFIWNYLIENGYKAENIVIMGDSAGGGLGLALTMYLRDNNVKPKAYMGLSPWVNLTATSECFTNPKKRQMDPLFGSNNVIEILGKMYAGEHDINDWRISPLNGNFDNLPKMFITYGELEILRDDIIDLYKRASKNNDVILKIYKKCQHDVITSDTKEAKIAMKDVVDFIKNL